MVGCVIEGLGETVPMAESMKSTFYKLLEYIRRTLWALIVAYMLGLHNFYNGDNKSVDDIAIKTEQNGAQESGTPKD